jgi:AcrR family transcriptional regulator
MKMARRSAADAAVTRERILSAARAQFAAEGYAGAAARDIAAEAGVTVGALFHHFGSKAGLFRAVFEQLIGELNDAAVAAFTGSNFGNPLDAMITSMTTALGFAKKADFHRIVTVDGPVVLGADEWRAIDSRMGLQTVVAGVRMLKSSGMIEDLPTMPTAVLLMGAMNNAGFALAREQAGVDVESLTKGFRRLVEGLAPRC